MRNVPGHTTATFQPPVRVPEPELVRQAAEVLSGKRKVAILAGTGARGASAELEQAAGKLASPIIKAQLGKDCVPDHRWDAEHALGSAAPMEVALAADGVAEVFDTMAPRMIARGLAAEPEQAVRVTASDSGGSWVYGPGKPIAEISGTAGDLLLMLWDRKPRDTDSLAWVGDREAGLGVLAGPLVPWLGSGDVCPGDDLA